MLSTLSKRERQVVVLLVQGHTNRECAEALNISLKTIDTHRGKALKKLGLRNNVELTRYAIKHGVIDVDGNELPPSPPPEVFDPPAGAPEITEEPHA